MKGQLKLDLIMKDINHNIIACEKRRKRHRTESFTLKLSSIIGSALVTVLLGIRSTQSYLMTDITLMLSVIISIFHGIEGFYNHSGLWVKDVKTLTSLQELKRDIEFHFAGEDEEHISIRALTAYKERLQHIINDDLKSWNKIKEEQNLLEHEENVRKL